jgi:bifunctional DNA-binding transcriptional regulator/antitoxin component of YhaV-PrlF toxin-antitoxin module
MGTIPNAIDNTIRRCHHHGMNQTVKMDRYGRVVIPLAVRERYGLLDDGYQLEIQESAEGIMLRPKPEDIPAERHASGWVVFRSGEEETIDPVQTIEEERERRDRQVRGDG